MNRIDKTQPERPTETSNRSWVGWTARTLSALLVAFWLFAVIASGLSEPWSNESSGILALVIISTSDVVLAWWRADVGGFALLATALAHGIFAYVVSGHNRGYVVSGHNRGIAVAITAGPFLIVALLFIAAWQYSGRRSGV